MGEFKSSSEMETDMMNQPQGGFLFWVQSKTSTVTWQDKKSARYWCSLLLEGKVVYLLACQNIQSNGHPASWTQRTSGFFTSITTTAAVLLLVDSSTSSITICSSPSIFHYNPCLLCSHRPPTTASQEAIHLEVASETTSPPPPLCHNNGKCHLMFNSLC